MKRRRPLPEPDDGTRLIGYARVSTEDQNLDVQIEALRKAGVLEDNLHFEKISGVKSIRPKLELALKDARPGDTFIVWKLDRLGRSMLDLLTKVDSLTVRNVGFKSITEGFDTTTPAGRMLFNMLGALAQFERDLIVERTKAGMAAARKRGRQIGAMLKMTDDKAREARRMHEAGMTVESIAKHFKVSRPTVYNALKRKLKK